MTVWRPIAINQITKENHQAGINTYSPNLSFTNLEMQDDHNPPRGDKGKTYQRMVDSPNKQIKHNIARIEERNRSREIQIKQHMRKRADQQK